MKLISVLFGLVAQSAGAVENFQITHTSKFEWDEVIILPSMAAMFATCCLRREYPVFGVTER